MNERRGVDLSGFPRSRASFGCSAVAASCHLFHGRATQVRPGRAAVTTCLQDAALAGARTWGSDPAPDRRTLERCQLLRRAGNTGSVSVSYPTTEEGAYS